MKVRRTKIPAAQMHKAFFFVLSCKGEYRVNVFAFCFFFLVVAHTQLQQQKTFITIQVTVSLFVVHFFCTFVPVGNQ